MIAISSVVAALDVCGVTLLVVDSLVAGGIADPALLVVHSSAVLFVSGLVNCLALGLIAGLALGFHLAFVGRVVHGFALPVTHSAAALLEECVVDCGVNGLVASPTLGSPVAVAISTNTNVQQGLKRRELKLC